MSFVQSYLEGVIGNRNSILRLSWMFLCLLTGIAVSQGQVVLSEVMFDADTLEYHNEFVEIFNAGKDTIDLNGWQIGDSLELDQITDAGYGMLLQPGQFGVILDGSYFGNSTTYDTLIPGTALILTINDGSFGQYGWSNSSAEPVIMTDMQGDTLQIYYYSADNLPGFSDEKIILNNNNSSANWSNSLVLRGTPGSLNSVSPAELDLELDTIWTEPALPAEGTSFTIRGTAKNNGLRAISQFSAILYEDLNENSIMDSIEIRNSKNFSVALESGDSTMFDIEAPGMPEGSHRLGVTVSLAGDEKPGNNTNFILVRIEPLNNPVIINEIMYRPSTGLAEWIEIYNRGEQPINMNNWYIADARDTVEINSSQAVIGPGEFLVLGKDSNLAFDYGVDIEKIIILASFPTLNNDQDDLRLLTLSGNLEERVSYSSDWMGRETEAGVSLERINPHLSSQIADNWTASVAALGCTPGRQNSVYIEKQVLKSSISIYPNPFSPDSDGFEDYALIQYDLPVVSAFVTVDIYDMLGRMVRRLSDRMVVGHEGSLVWDGRDDAGRVARMGMYIVLFRVFDANRKMADELKTTVVLVKQ